MSVVVGYRDTAEGRTALKAAVNAARNRGEVLVVVDLAQGRAAAATQLDAVSQQELDALAAAGSTVDVRKPGPGTHPEDAVLDAVDDEASDLVVVGVRRRTAVGKFLLGSSAQRLILGADCPVLVVKTTGH